MEIKCDCCNEYSESGMIGERGTGKVICFNCLKYAPVYYGLTSSKDLIKYIKNKKERKWWQIWKN